MNASVSCGAASSLIPGVLPLSLLFDILSNTPPCFLRILLRRDKPHLVNEPHECNSLKRLGHPISYHISPRDISNVDLLHLNHVSDKVMADINMLRAFVEFRVLCKGECSLIVT